MILCLFNAPGSTIPASVINTLYSTASLLQTITIYYIKLSKYPGKNLLHISYTTFMIIWICNSSHPNGLVIASLLYTWLTSNGQGKTTAIESQGQEVANHNGLREKLRNVRLVTIACLPGLAYLARLITLCLMLTLHHCSLLYTQKNNSSGNLDGVSCTEMT